jgi:hypothetical protein
VTAASSKLVARVVEHLRAHPDKYGPPKPHPRAQSLELPDGTKAPASLCAWAEYDRRYPWYLSSRRSDQEIADARGKLKVKAMNLVLRYVCLDSVRDELEGDDETIAYLKDMVAKLSAKYAGHGVVLEPDESPTRMLWIPPRGEPEVLWYDNDAIDARKPFGKWLSDLFFDQ